MRHANSMRGGRGGFTLLELLVVIAIITVLIGLTAAAVFRVQAGQSLKRTESVLAKIHSGLDQQWKATIDNAFRTNIPDKVLQEWALNDIRRAKALWVKFNLKREFPESFKEVRDTYQSYPVYVDSQGKKEYFDAVGMYNGPNGPPDLESAALLYMVLSTARRGMDFTSDETLGPATRTIQIGGGNFKVFVDSWGTPIKYVRWVKPDVVNQALRAEMSLPEFSPAKQTFKDREDPEGMLLRPALNPLNTWPDSTRTAAALLLLGHDASNNPYDFQNETVIPTAISAGSDKRFNASYQFDTGDDIFSFRLRKERQRGE
jgi:prepilin-type N-terminal cleavage/methylation domain-containing protein